MTECSKVETLRCTCMIMLRMNRTLSLFTTSFSTLERKVVSRRFFFKVEKMSEGGQVLHAGFAGVPMPVGEGHF